jgi:hypothetical protein
MDKRLRCFITLVMAGLLSSCVFDSGIEWRGGPYVLIWIDTAENLTINRDEGEGAYSGRIDSTVFAVGWDGRYLVAKQHPDGDRSKTHYFVLDSSKDTDVGEPEEVVTGPLSAVEFQQKSNEMGLPPFSKVLISLE